MKRAPPATPSKVAKRRAAATPAPKAKPKPVASASHTPAWAAAGLAHVAKADGGRLKAIIDEHGPPGYLGEQVAEDAACGALCRIVVGQQLTFVIYIVTSFYIRRRLKFNKIDAFI